MTGLALAAVLAAAWAGTSEAAETRDPNARYSLSLGPSLHAPHMGELNKLIEEAPVPAGWNPTANYTNPSGFKGIALNGGGQIKLAYHFDDDLRGGLQLGTNWIAYKDTLHLSNVTSGTMIADATASLELQLPLAKIGVFFEKVFQFEEDPRLQLYAGGWADLGTLIGARAKARSTAQVGESSDAGSVSADLNGNGWGAGGLGGA